MAAAIFGLSGQCLAALLSARLHYPGRPSVENVTALFVLVLGIVWIFRGAILLCRLAIAHEQQPVHAWAEAIRKALPSFAMTAVGAAFICAFLVSINWLKSLMPFLVPFWADKPLATFDITLFGGHPRIPVTLLFSGPYAVWQGVHLGTILWVLHWRESAEKDWALLSLLATWTIGMILAFSFSSAGPIFTGQAVSDRLTMIEAHYLWVNYKSAGAVIGGGISAFPSMHVAIACWVAFVLWLRRIRYVGPLFVVLVSLGAIALGWHYSLDVVGGLVVAFAGIFVASFAASAGPDSVRRVQILARMA
jgi:membrane-associated phospholipid phosphatase